MRNLILRMICRQLLLLSSLIYFPLALSLSASGAGTVGYSGLLINVGARESKNLSGEWRYIIDPYKTALLKSKSEPKAVFLDRVNVSPHKMMEYSFDNSPYMSVPGDWNGQVAEMALYEGLVWFRKEVQLPKVNDKRYLLHIGAANYKSYVYVNGKKVGEHEGGFTPFAFDVTNNLKVGRNSVVIGVDSEHEDDSVPTPVTDWKNFGGITRDVHLLEVPNTYISTYFIQLESSDVIKANVSLSGERINRREVTVRIPELGVMVSGITDADGKITVEVKTPEDMKFWAPSSPILYEVIISTADETVSDRIGFRTIESVDGELLLNGEPIFLRGISIHEEALGATPNRAINTSSARALLSIAKKDLKANFVRLAHYPHSDITTRVADELGLLVWSEIPVYWDMDFGNKKTLALARKMQSDNIIRDKNRASIILWSVANETKRNKKGAALEERTSFLRTLITDIREVDDTRLITSALHKAKPKNKDGRRVYVIDDSLARYIDVVSVNTYQGWYSDMKLEDVAKIKWELPKDKPFLFSEFGAGALYGYRDDNLAKFSEDYQAEYYKANIEMCRNIDGLDGLSPWILKDFKSPRRMHGQFQQYWNRKGIISPEGNFKAAFGVLRGWYNELAGL